MATDTDHHHAYCSHLRHPSGFSSDPQFVSQDVSISELVNHGSISFGRFASEPLEWEKRSVFSHNRCQEELEKFKAPGIVAQKKAFFEEYYRKIRAAKKLQSEEQEICQSDPRVDKHSFTSQVQNSAEISNSNEVKNSDIASQIKISAEKRNAHHDITAESNKGKSLVTEKQKDNYKDNVIKKVQSKITLDAAGREYLDKSAKVPSSSAKTCSKSSLPNRVTPVTVGLNANKLNAHTVPFELKGPGPLAKEGTMLNTRTRRNAAKLPEKGKPLTGNDRSSNANRRSVMSEKATHLLQRNVKCKNLAVHTNPTRFQSSTKVSHPAVSRHIPATCSNTKNNLAKANLSFGLKGESTSRHTNVTNKVNNVAGERPSSAGKALDSSSRSINCQTETNQNIKVGKQIKIFVGTGKALDSSSRYMAQRSGQSENHKPKIMSINCQTETNQNIKVGKQIKETHIVHGRVSNTATTAPCGANKATSSKLQKKVVPRANGQFGTPTSAGKEQRNKLPSWR